MPSVKDIVKGAGVDAGGIVADVITTVIGRDNPRTPEFTPSGAGPIPRCQRWESDYVTTIKDDPGPIETTLLATAQLNIIKNMKAEGCSRPSSIPARQWNEV